MPTSIPYDPSLTLGNVVDPKRLANLVAIAKLQAPVDAAQETLNSYLTLKRSLDMTIRELDDLKVDASHVREKMVDVDQHIALAAKAYADIKLETEINIQPMRMKISDVSRDVESPIDYNHTKITSMALSADSLRLDVQYFSFEDNEQKSRQTMQAIKGFITESVSDMGDGESSEAATTAMKQINTQRQYHDIQGTLIIAACCTHQNAQVLAPFVLDADKAIRVWNTMYPGARMNPGNKLEMEKILTEADRPEKLTLLSGTTLGSSFVAMVHLLRREATTSDQTMTDNAAMAQAQGQMELIGLNISGGIGFDADTAKDIKNLLSSVTVDSHVSLITRGVIPTIKSNELKTSVTKFSDDSWNNMGEKLQALQNATQTEFQTMASSAQAARTGQTMVALEGAKITNALTTLAKIDEQSNKVLDINSLMTAFEDYIDRIGQGKVGIPLNYYTKDLQRSQLAQMWANKYFPGKYVGLSSDDAGTGRNAEGAQAGSAAAPADTPPAN